MFSTPRGRILPLFGAILLPLFLDGCALTEGMKRRQAEREEARQWDALRSVAAAEHSAFRAKKGWRSKTYKNQAVLARTSKDNSSIHISLREQRGYLVVRETIAMEFPVATGKRSHPTPKGDYKILGKVKDYHSNLYGKIYDNTGAVVVADADMRKDAIPEGGNFAGAPMLYWMRLTNDGVGLHVGYVPGRPASHGCIRMPSRVAPSVFDLVKVGTPVTIADGSPAI